MTPPMLLLSSLLACAGSGPDTAGPTSEWRQDSGSDCQPEEERCDGLDQDCDGAIDEDLPLHTWYADRDGDQHGDPEAPQQTCSESAPAQHVAHGTDCDDGDPEVYPGAPEVCDDGVWNGCEPVDSCSRTGFSDLADADVILVGEAAEDLAGRCAAWTGDVNGDGFDDLFVDAQESGVNGVNSGSAYFYPGPLAPGELDMGEAPVRLRGDGPLQWAARSIGGAGDTNGDGFDDVVVGVIRHDHAGFRAGGAYVLPGPLEDGDRELADANAGFLYAEGEYEAAGSWVSAAGDVNADGLADVLIAAMYSDRAGKNNGAVYVLHGPITGQHALVDRADAIFDGEPLRDNDWAGRTVANAGDIDSDGYDDFVIGADGNDRGGEGAGAAYLVLGPVSGVHNLVTADTIYTGEYTNHRIGGSVASAGDTDGDGRPELILGAFGHSFGAGDAGAFYLVDGTERGVVPLQGLEPFRYGDQAGDWFGYYVDGVGDTNDDGFDDVIVGSPGSDGSGVDAGAAYLFRGPFSGSEPASSADLILPGELDGDQAGYSAAGGGDLNGDGLQDLLVGAFGSDRGGTNSGASYVVFSHGR